MFYIEDRICTISVLTVVNLESCLVARENTILCFNSFYF